MSAAETPAELLDHYEGAVRSLARDPGDGHNVYRMHAYQRDLLALAAGCGNPRAALFLLQFAETVAWHELEEYDEAAAIIERTRVRQVADLVRMLGGAS